MLDLVNKTPFSAALVPALEKDGAEYLVVLAKATFSLAPGRMPAVADEQEPVQLADVHLGEAGKSSVLYESEAALRKPGVDVILIGSAHGPSGGASVMEVELRVAGARKVVRVFGPRVWSRSGPSARPSQPGRITTVPLVWERAFGGVDGEHREERNPIGAGFAAPRSTRDTRDTDGQLLPQIEDPAEPLQQLGDRPTPAGFGFVSRAWAPRVRLAGTYDDAWRSDRAPLLPLDFDDRFFLGAPAGLAVPELKGGEPLSVHGVLPGGRALEIAIPRRAVEVRVESGATSVVHPARLDTVVLEPERQRLLLTYRASVPVRRRLLDVDRVRVREVAS